MCIYIYIYTHTYIWFLSLFVFCAPIAQSLPPKHTSKTHRTLPRNSVVLEYPLKAVPDGLRLERATAFSRLCDSHELFNDASWYCDPCSNQSLLKASASCANIRFICFCTDVRAGSTLRRQKYRPHYITYMCIYIYVYIYI